MNRQDLLNDIADRMDREVSKAQIDRFLTALQDSVADSLRRGEAVTLVGWGTWRLHRRAAREGRNPTTGQPLTIKAARIPKWTAGTAFRAAMSGRNTSSTSSGTSPISAISATSASIAMRSAHAADDRNLKRAG